MGKYFFSQTQIGLTRNYVLIGFHFFEYGRVIFWRNEYGYILVVLGGSTQHRWTTNINVLNRILKRAIGFGNCLVKWIEIDHEHIDRIDTMFFQGSHVLRKISASQ